MHIIRSKIPDMQDQLDWVEPPLKVEPQYIMFSRRALGFEKKLADFNAGLQQITDSGDLQKILNKHGM
jgi:polar amino acid transport system substrate-binding protein